MVNHEFEILLSVTGLVIGLAFLWIARIDAR